MKTPTTITGNRVPLMACRLGVGLSCLLLIAEAATACEAPRPPNIVIILADDLGYGDLGCYGSKEIKTPNIDAMASDGMKFTDFYVNAPVCSPTRAGFLTGRSHVRCGAEHVFTPADLESGLPLNERTLAEELKRGGYATGLFGKWHLGYAEKFNPTRRGFDRFVGHLSGFLDYHTHVNPRIGYDWWDGLAKTAGDGCSTDLIGKHSVEFVKKHKGKPFFLFVSHQAPHSPYQGPEDGPLIRWEDGKAVKTQEKQDKEERYAKYIAMTERMDQTVGDLLEVLEDEGLAGRTLVLFVSDNGPSYLAGTTGGLRGGKHSLWEGGIRVPAVARWPGKIKAGAVTDQPATVLDLFPTFLTLAGVKPEADATLDGIDIGPLLFQGKSLPERPLCWRYLKYVAVRHGKWKLVGKYDRQTQQADFSGRHGGLFDLKADPAEEHDLAAEHPEIVEKLKRAYQAWEASVADDRKRRQRKETEQ